MPWVFERCCSREYKNACVHGPLKLKFSGYSGTAGDSLGPHSKGSPFSTWDQDNDAINGSCAQGYQGAWWYLECHHSNLNGLYRGGAHSSFGDGVNWYAWKGFYYSLKFTEMKLREDESEGIRFKSRSDWLQTW